jgi:hypothetical protein
MPVLFLRLSDGMAFWTSRFLDARCGFSSYRIGRAGILLALCSSSVWVFVNLEKEEAHEGHYVWDVRSVSRRPPSPT